MNIYYDIDRISQATGDAYRIEQIKFADGTSWNNQTIIAQSLIGNDADNVINGYEGDDTLDGGKGNDVLNGGYGNNTYLFGRGDGQDKIESFDPTPGKFNTIQLKAGISQSDVSVMRSGNGNGIDLILSIKDTNDAITITSFFRPGFGDSYKVEQIKFADGITWNIDAKLLLGDGPVLTREISDQSVNKGALFQYVVPDTVFTDTNSNDVLSYSATLADGKALPGWLKFDAATHTLSGTPARGDVGVTSVKIMVTNLAGAQASDVFDLTVVDVNSIPVLSAPLAAQSIKQNTAFSYTLPTTAFTDTDAGDKLTYSATLTNGNALPAWLKFDAATRKLSGKPANGDVGVLGIKLIATDKAGATASGNFNLTVVNVNDAPVLSAPLTNQSVKQNDTFRYTLPVTAFTDIDVGDVLTYSATLANGKALPSWLKFDAANRTFSGTPANGDVGVVSIKLSAKDVAGKSASGTFNLTVVNVNDAPVLTKALAAQSVKQNATFSYTLPASAFTDSDMGDKLTYSATLANGDVLPAWLKFNAATRKLSGKPANGDVGVLGIKLIATDKAGATASGNFNLTVVNVNDAPVLSAPLADRSINKNTAFSYTLPTNAFTDIDVGDKLTYKATLSNGKALPSWLKFDAASRTFSGTPTTTGNTTVRVTATDLAGAKAHDDFVMSVVNNLASAVNPALMRASEVSEYTPQPEITPLNAWDLSASLLQFHLTSSDTAALGGDFMYQGANESTTLQATQALLAGTDSIKVDQKGLSGSKQVGLF